MEIHIQKCQQCQATNLKNIIYRESGEPDRVYVQCHDCQHFVASYVIAPLGYYHNGKGYESFLRGVQRSGGFMSGRNVKQLFLARKNDEQAAFDEVIENLRLRDKKRNSGDEGEEEG
ncbi:MAG: coenzyme F420-reducing hydrogenase beta subunit [Saprospiraceae bacterium]|jgi:coenzyme F420-reducing hydrogenase beta subunit